METTVYMLRLIVTALALAAALAACGQTTGSRLSASPGIEVQAAPTRALAGTWEYEEAGFAYPITLDRSGNGTYDWKDGAFVTTQVEDRTWKGRWVQAANDREGRFVIKLGPDYSEGRGRWWYTRIGENETPQRPGGTFYVNKVAAP